MIPEKPNDFDQNNPTINDRDKSIKISCLWLLGLSILSALAIASLWLAFPWNLNLGLAGMFPFLFIWTVQIILAVPATLLVFFAHEKLARRNKFYEMPPLVRIGIPLIFNGISAVFSFYIIAAILSSAFFLWQGIQLGP